LICKKENRIILESDIVKLIVEPENGGKIRSFISKASGWDFFFQDKRTNFSDRGFSYRDTSGLEECFPTVAPCQFTSASGRKFDYADHGYLWQSLWETDINDEMLTMSKDMHEINCSFQKTLELKDNTLNMKYIIRNYGKEAVPYLYSVHPMLSANKHTRLELTDEVEKVYMCVSSDNSGFKDGSWIDLPSENNRALFGPFSRSNDAFVKFFTDSLEKGGVKIKQLDTNESLVFDYDTQTLPHLGVLAVEGVDILNDGEFKDIVFLGLEPTTGIGDDLNTCKETGTLRELKPKEELKFWISLSLENI